jgi:hypothetical protein
MFLYLKLIIGELSMYYKYSTIKDIIMELGPFTDIRNKVMVCEIRSLIRNIIIL